MGGGVWTTLATNVLRSRWFVVVAGIWIQSTYGTAYCFGVYSQSLKLAMDYNQETLNTLAAFKTLGGAVGIVSGLLYDVFPWPWLVLAIGAVQNVFGYFMMWLAITARIARPPLWQMCVFLYVGTNSSTFAATAVVVTCLKIFPSNRGIVIGFLKGFVALGAAIMTQLFYVLYPGDPQSFLLMVSWLPALVSLLFMGVIRPIPPAAAVRVQGDHEEDEGSNFNLLLVISILLGGFLMGVIILQNVVQLGHSTMLVIACLIIFVLVFLPFGIVVRSELASYYKQPTTLQEPLFTDEQRNLNSSSGSQFHSQEQSEFVAADLTEEGKKPDRGEEHTVMEAICSLDFWLLFMVMVCSLGSGTTAMDNMGQIGLSLGYTQVQINTLVALLSIWNCFGRFGGGFISELLLHSKDIPRPFSLALSLAVLCGGHIVMAFAFPGSIYVGSIIVGLCYGAQWSLMLAITSEFFGLNHFGTLFNSLGLASPVGTYILSVRVAGYLYDIEAKKEHGLHTTESWGVLMHVQDSGPLLCHGAHCFRLTFVILAFVCLFGCFISWVLLLRTRYFYHQLHQRLQDILKSFMSSSLYFLTSSLHKASLHFMVPLRAIAFYEWEP
ncbi:unnamed protein product [Sphagnum troendelagicum]